MNVERNRSMKTTIHIEATFKGKSCLSCVYMGEAVLDVLPKYGDKAIYSKVDIFTAQGKKRFLDLSCSLFGEMGVYEHHRLAPIPSLFIDGELYFDAIPSRDELEAAIDRIHAEEIAETGDSKRQGKGRHAEKSCC